MLTDYIKTSRLILKRPEKEHFIVLRGLWLDDKVRKFLGGSINEAGVNGKIKELEEHWVQNSYGQYAVYEKRTMELIGICGFQNSEDGIELIYMFFDKFWGQGYATEAAMATLKYGFNHLKFDSIIAITQDANKSSCKLLEKTRMRYITKFTRYNAVQRLYRITQGEWSNFDKLFL